MPKGSARPPSVSFITHFSLKGMERGGKRGGDQMQVVWDQGCSWTPVPHFQIRGLWVFHNSVVRTGGGWVEKGKIKRNATFGMPLVFFKISRGNICKFSKCFTASSLFFTDQGFNSEAAGVIFIPFDSYIFTNLSNTSLWLDRYYSEGAWEFLGALLFFPSHWFHKKANQWNGAKRTLFRGETDI